MALKDVSVRFSADTTGLNRGLKQAQAGITKLNSGLSSIVKTAMGLAGISAGIAGLVALAEQYRGLRNSVQRVNELFRDSSKYIKAFAKDATKSLGMAETTAYEFSMTYGNLFKAITSGTRENAKVTMATLKATAVIASKTGRTMEDVGARIRSGILGNVEAIESLGIYTTAAMIKTTEAFKKIAGSRSWDQLTYQEQQQIRTLAILEQAQSQYGDNVSMIAGISLPRLRQAFKDLTAYVGMLVNAGLQPFINALGQIVYSATAAVKAIANLMGLDVAGGVKPAAAAEASLADAADDATTALEKQKKALAGFDELNIIDMGEGETSTAGGGTAGPSPFDELPELPELPDELGTGKLEEQLKGFISLFDFTNIKESWANLKESLSPLGEHIGAGAKWLYDNVLVPLGKWTIGDFVPAWFDALGAAIGVTTEIISALKPQGLWLWNNFLQPVAGWTGGAIVSVLETLTGALQGISGWINENQGLVQAMTITVAGFFAAWKLVELMSFIGQAGGVVGAFNNIKKAIEAATVAKIKDKIETLALSAMYAKDFLKSLATSTAELVVNTGKWIANTAAKAAGAVQQGIVTAATTAWNVVATIGSAVTTAFGAAMAFLTSPITLVVLAIGAVIAAGVLLYKNWDKIKAAGIALWDKLKSVFGVVGDFFDDLWDGVKSGFVAFVNYLIEGVNFLIKGWLLPFNLLIKGWNATLGKLIGTIPEIKVEIPKIPQMAQGGIVDKPTVAMVGEAGPEAVIPLKNTDFTDSLASAIGTAVLQAMQLGRENESGENTAILEVDGTKLARVLLPKINREIKRLGLRPILT